MERLRYFAKSTVQTVNQGGTAGEVYTLVLGRKDNSVKGGLFYVPGRN